MSITFNPNSINPYAFLYGPVNETFQTSGGVHPPNLTPLQRLQRLQAWFGDGTSFHWTAGPTPVKRGVFPTWNHVKTWYDVVVSLGYDIEDIGFSWEELHPIWAKYARETFPVVYANYNKLYPNDYPME